MITVMAEAHIGDNLASLGLEVSPFDSIRELGRRGLRGKDRATLLALGAAKRLMDAHPMANNGRGTILLCSSSLGSPSSVYSFFSRAIGKGYRALLPQEFANILVCNLAGQTAIHFGLTGPWLCLGSGVVGGMDAIYLAVNSLKQNVGQVICLAAEENGVQRQDVYQALGWPGEPWEAGVALLLGQAKSDGNLAVLRSMARGFCPHPQDPVLWREVISDLIKKSGKGRNIEKIVTNRPAYPGLRRIMAAVASEMINAPIAQLPVDRAYSAASLLLILSSILQPFEGNRLLLVADAAGHCASLLVAPSY